jgi:hypothetical protein
LLAAAAAAVANNRWNAFSARGYKLHVNNTSRVVPVAPTKRVCKHFRLLRVATFTPRPWRVCAPVRSRALFPSSANSEQQCGRRRRMRDWEKKIRPNRVVFSVIYVPGELTLQQQQRVCQAQRCKPLMAFNAVQLQ